MDIDDGKRWHEQFGERIGRRSMLRGGLLAAAGLAAGALIGCGDDDDDDDDEAAPATPTATATAAATATPTAEAAKPAPAEESWYSKNARDDGAPYDYGYEEPDTPPKAGGVLRLAVPWSIGAWDTNQTSASHAVSLAQAVANRLVGIKTGPEMNKYAIEVEPELAKSWETAPDGLSYTFHLEQGVKFQNVAPVSGRDFTSLDIVQAYDRAAASPTNKQLLELTNQRTAPDDYTVNITMKQPDADFLNPLSSRFMPIYPQEIVDSGLIETQAIGTGPFILENVEIGFGFTTVKNQDYFEGEPYLDGIEWRRVTDNAARTAAFRAGQIEHGLQARTKQERDALLQTNPDTRITSDPILAGIGILAVNSNHPKLADERVRQALLLSIDRERMVQIIQQGAGAILPAFGWPFVFDETPTGDELGPNFRYDPGAAKQKLAAAGAEGLELDLISRSSYSGTAVSDEEVLIGEFFEDIGVKLNARTIENQAFNAQFYGRKFAEDGQLIGGWASQQAPTANGYFHDNIHSESGKNLFAIRDPQLDEWATKQRGILDPEERRPILRQIWDRTLEKAYRLETTSSFIISIYPGYLRYWRWNGPYIGYIFSWDWGVNSHLGWIDK